MPATWKPFSAVTPPYIGCHRETALQRYGSNVHAEEGTGVNRAALGRIVFQVPTEQQWLEQLTHPIV